MLLLCRLVQAARLKLFVTNNSDMAIDINGYFAGPASGGLSLYN